MRGPRGEDDLVEDVADAVATSRDVEWDSCAQRATHADRRRLDNLRALSAIFSSVPQPIEDRLPAGATPGRQSAGAGARWAMVLLVVVAGWEIAATLILLPGGWSDYRRAYGDLAIFLTAMLAGHGASACVCFYGGLHDRRMRMVGAYCLLWVTFPAAHMLPILLWGIPRPGELPGAVHIYPFVLAPAFLWAFARDFPETERRTAFDDLVRRMVVFSAVLGVALYVGFTLASYLAQSGFVDAAVFFVGWDVAFAVLNLLDLLAVAAVALRTRRAVIVEVERAKLFAAGFVTWVGWIVVSDAIELLWPMPLSFSGQWGSLALAGGAIRVLGMFMLWHAVLTKGELSVRSLVWTTYRSLLAYRVLGLVLAVPLAGLAWQVAGYPELGVDAVLGDPMALVLITTIGVALPGLLARERLVILLDAWTYPDTRKQRRALAAARAALERAGRIAEVEQVVVGTAQCGCGAPAALLVASRADAATACDFSAPDASVGPLSRASSIVHVLETTRAPLPVHPHDGASSYELLPDADAAWVVAAGATLMVPILGPGADLNGVLLLRRRSEEHRIRPVDVPFLEALAEATGITVERLGRLNAPATQQADAPSAYECSHCHSITAAGEPLGCGCGAPYVEAEVPRFLAGKFRLSRRLGAGGMGAVYLARDMGLDRDVAVKTLMGTSPSGLTRLRQEARTMANVTHPAVAQIYGIESWRGRPFLIVEFLAGGTLADRLGRKPLPASQAVSVTGALANALATLHEAGYLHGDVKPSNIGFASDGSAKLLDFGLARLTDEGTTMSGGTLAYLSPEVLAGEAPEEGDDVWALCVALYEMVSARYPFAAPGATTREVRDGIRRQRIDPSFAKSEASPRAESCLIAFATSVLTASRSRRPATAGAFAQALRTTHERG